MALLNSALTYGKRKRAPYESDLISEAATRLPALYSIKDAKAQAAEEAALQEKGIAQTAELANLSRASTERIATGRNELDRALNAASIKSNEAIAGKQNELTRLTQSFNKKQAKTSSIISGVGLGLSAAGLLSDMGGGSITGGIMSLWESINPWG